MSRIINYFLRKLGFKITRIGLGFLDARETIEKSVSEGLSLNEYVEKHTDREEKKGRRDRVINRLKHSQCLTNLQTICEIGPGTGRYIEGLLNESNETSVPIKRYEIYETDSGWRKYLYKQYSTNNLDFICHVPDGVSLKSTADLSCDLVTAHAVFVYLPMLQSTYYIKECMRICRPGGFLAFDFLPAEDFQSPEIVEQWLTASHNWPVTIPRKLIDEYTQSHGFNIVDRFREPYGETESEYVIYQRSS